MPDPLWHLESGSLRARVRARSMSWALEVALRQKRPRSLGNLVRGRRICCANRLHGPHFVVFYLSPMPTLRKLGWYRP
jgi:hypothetical protein